MGIISDILEANKERVGQILSTVAHIRFSDSFLILFVSEPFPKDYCRLICPRGGLVQFL